MPWWGWVLIVAGVLIIGALKLFFFNRSKAKKKTNDKQDHSKED